MAAHRNAPFAMPRSGSPMWKRRPCGPAAFAAPEQAALARAEQFPFEHHGISDAAVDWAKTQLGAKAIVALLVALAFFDVSCRWKLAFDLETQPVRTDHPPLNEGALV